MNFQFDVKVNLEKGLKESNAFMQVDTTPRATSCKLNVKQTVVFTVLIVFYLQT